MSMTLLNNSTNRRAKTGVARMKDKSHGFAPHAEPPDRIFNKLRSDTPFWVMMVVFALSGLGAYIRFRSALTHETHKTLAGYDKLIKLSPPQANITIILP